MFKKLFGFLNKEKSSYTKWFREWNPYVDFTNIKFQANVLYGIKYTRFFRAGKDNPLDGPVFRRFGNFPNDGIIINPDIDSPVGDLIRHLSKNIPAFVQFEEYRTDDSEEKKQKALYAFHLYMALLEIFVCNHPMIKYKENYKKIS